MRHTSMPWKWRAADTVAVNAPLHMFFSCYIGWSIVNDYCSQASRTRSEGRLKRFFGDHYGKLYLRSLGLTRPQLGHQTCLP